MRDPYLILGIAPASVEAEIRVAYRNLAREHHPDHAGQDHAARFQEITWAWNLLRNPQKRSEYDQKRADQPAPTSPVNHGSLPAQGEHVETEIHISFKEAYHGTKVNLVVNKEEICSHCSGSGSKPGHVPYPCVDCKGSGFHEAGRMREICATCQGRGMIVDVPCDQCQKGLIVIPKQYEVQVPQGAHPGDTITLYGEGRPGWDRPGDLLVKVHVTQSQVYKYGPDVGDITVEVPIHWSESVLGGSVIVPAPSGPVRIQLPSGTQSGKHFRIRSEGLKRPDGTRGHLYAQIVIHVPDNPVPEQRRLIASLRAWEDNAIRQRLLDNAENEWNWGS